MRFILLSWIIISILHAKTSASDLPFASYHSQNEIFYKISNEEALELTETISNTRVDPKYFHTPLNPTGQDITNGGLLPVGHYLKVRFVDQKVLTDLKSVNNTSITILNNMSDLNIRITDLSGELIHDAHVRINGKTIPYDKYSKTYRLPKFSKDGLLTVFYDGHLQIAQLNNFHYRNTMTSGLRSLLYSNPLFHFAVSTAEIAINLPYDILLTINNLRPQGSIYKTYSYARSIVDPDWDFFPSAQFNGYIEFNKPVYRPNDTVYYKAFIVHQNGAPLRGNVQLQLDYPGRPAIIADKIQNFAPGAFEGSFVLHDSLNLVIDDRYKVSVTDGKRTSYISDYIHLEDYELGNIKLALKTDQYRHFRGNDLNLEVYGLDENDLPLHDARIEVSVCPQVVGDFFADHLFIPDTLYKISLPLLTEKPTTVVIPDNIFPEANINYRVYVTLISFDNQKAEEWTSLSFLHLEKRLDYRRQDSVITFYYRENGISKERNARLHYKDALNHILLTKDIILPYTETFRSDINQYYIESEDLTVSVNVYDIEPRIHIKQQRNHNQVQFWVENDEKLPFHYFLFKNNREISRGYDSTFIFEQNARQKDYYRLTVFFPWAGSRVGRSAGSYLREKELTLEVLHPDQIFPGQAATVEVSVTDSKGMPAKNTDLTAWSWTSKFDDYYFKFPVYFGDFPVYPEERNFFRTEPAEFNGFSYFFETPELWLPISGLDTVSYFQFHFPGEEVFTAAIPTFTGITQMSPFVMHNGGEIKIHALYLNDNLKYSSLTSNHQPWSFRAEPGYNNLRIRTEYLEITIDSLYCEEGKKTIVSLDARNLKNAQIKEASPYLSSEEREEILPGIFAYHLKNKEELMLLEHEDEIFILNGPNSYMAPDDFRFITTAGPIFADSVLIKNQDKGLGYLSFDHKYYHIISDSGYKEIKTFYPRLSQLVNYGKRHTSLNEEVLTKELLDTNMRLMHQLLNQPFYPTHQSFATNAATGTLHISKDTYQQLTEKYQTPSSLILQSTADSLTAKIYPSNQKSFVNVPEGEYIITYVFHGEVFLNSLPFNVAAHGKTYHKLHFDKLPAPVKAFSDFFRELSEGYITGRSRTQRDYSFQKSIPWLFQNPLNINISPILVKGGVYDATSRLPLSGVSISMESTSFKTETDSEGYFEMVLPFEGSLTAWYPGMQTQMFNSGDNYIVIFMQSETEINTGFNEVIQAGRSGRIRLTNSFSVPVTSPPPPPIRERGINADFAIQPPPPPPFYETSDNNPFSIYGNQLPDSRENLPGAIRTNFRDYAYWQPQLRTDIMGKASFEVTFPDDITKWRTFFRAMNPNMETGFHASEIRSFLPLSAQISLPRFIVAGDTAYAKGRITSYLGDTLMVNSFYEINGEKRFRNEHLLFNTIIDTLPITSNSADSVKLKYHTTFQDFTDGEERILPVISRGVETTTGHFCYLHSDTTIHWNFDESLGDVTLFIRSNPLDLFMEKIENLINFSYHCNEQEASRLIALLAQKQLYEKTGKPFQHERTIRSVIRSLSDNQNSQGLWGWWARSENTSIWMSAHVIRALSMAMEHGYSVNLTRPLTMELLLFHWDQNSSLSDKYELLKMMLKIKSDADIDELLSRLSAQNHDPYAIAEIKQLAGHNDISPNILSNAQHTLIGNMYFPGNSSPRSMDSNTLTNTLTAYRIFQRQGGEYQRYLDPVLNYILETHSGAIHSNTYFTSLIIHTLLPTLLEKLQEGNSEENHGISVLNKFVVNDFPAEFKLPADNPFTITKKGSGSLYITAWQKYFEENPSDNSNGIQVDTWFEDDSLTTGNEVVLNLEVKLSAAAEYLMVEVPIPAGCTYSDNQKSGLYETHREQFRHKTTLFFQRLEPGTHYYEIRLLPRFSGSYTLNPAKAELMYFPTFNANNGIKKIVIEN